MKLKFFFPVLCALIMGMVACVPKDEPKDPTQQENKDPNQKDDDQDSKAPKLDVTEIKSTELGGEYKVALTSPAVWVAESDMDWVTINPTSGKSDATITVTVAPGYEADTAKVEFSNDGGSKVLLVYRDLSEVAPNGIFSVSETTKVRFSSGNLQYKPYTKEWRFAKEQYNIIGENNKNISPSYTGGWLDLFGWGTGDDPTKHTETPNDYATFVDWGKNITPAGEDNIWRTLTSDEWEYLFQKRPDARQLYGSATIDAYSKIVHGIVIMPDNYKWLNSTVSFNPGMNGWDNNVYGFGDWAELEELGVVFLPAAGMRSGKSVSDVGEVGHYWSSTSASNVAAMSQYISDDDCWGYGGGLFFGYSVRLVQDVK